MNIAETIEQALAQAGLGKDRPGAADIHRVIEQALGAAGLMTRPATGDVARPDAPPHDRPAPGSFTPHQHAGPHGERRYKLFVPALAHPRPMPLVVMLHGCKQNPDDFAAGTRMNELAQARGFIVAWPEQTARANGSNCWNWFEPGHQGRQGEPAILAGIVADIRARHDIVPGQVFAAGLSAGAAMALILGQRYPEVFSAVAAHSGLPVGAAHDVASAFAAMQGRASASRQRGEGAAVRTMVLHGTADTTVAPANADQVTQAAVAAHERHGTRLTPLVRTEAANAGRGYTTTRFLDAEGNVQVEQWLVAGSAHAWSGGSPDGSFTDGLGPDASRAVIDFFLDE